MIICLCGQKGGSGKTTAATSIAAEYHRRGIRTLLADADPQGTARDWATQHDEGPPVWTLPENFHQPGSDGLAAKAAAYDRIVVDTPPKLHVLLQRALFLADVAIIPCRVSGAETWALRPTLERIEMAEAMRPDRPLTTLLLLNQKRRTAMQRQIRGVLEGETGRVVLQTELWLRVAYEEALTAGQGPTTYEPDGVAAREVAALVDEIESLTKGGKNEKTAAA